MDNYTADICAEVSGFPRGGLGAMTMRGQTPRFPYELPDLLSLSLARKLKLAGMNIGPATAIAWAARDIWAEVALADDKAKPDHERTRFVAVAPNEPGDRVPYTWVLAGSGDALVDFIAAGDARGLGPTIVVNVTRVAREVMTNLLASLKKRDPEAAEQLTSNGTWGLRAAAAPDRELA